MDLPITTRTIPTSATARHWKSEPDGPNDRPIEIWCNNSWVPAFFSDLQDQDFFIDLKANLDPDRCFKATSNLMRSVFNGIPSFVIKGLEIVQAPKIEEKVITALPSSEPLLLEQPTDVPYKEIL